MRILITNVESLQDNHIFRDEVSRVHVEIQRDLRNR